MKAILLILAAAVVVALCAIAVLRPSQEPTAITPPLNTGRNEAVPLGQLDAVDESGSREPTLQPQAFSPEHDSSTMGLARNLASSFAPGDYPDPGRVLELLSAALSELNGAGANQPNGWEAEGIGERGQNSGSGPWGAGAEYSLELRFPLRDLTPWPDSRSAALVLSVDGISDPRPPGFVRAWIQVQPAEDVDGSERRAMSALMSLDLEDGWLRYGDIYYEHSNKSLQRLSRWRSPIAQQYLPDLASTPIDTVEALAKTYASNL